MRNTIIKSILILVLAFLALPMMGQDFMNIYFKDGTFKIFHFSNIQSLSTSKIDTEGYEQSDGHYQHVKTLTNEFIYDLNDIDRIEFTKYKENEVLDNISETMEEVLPFLNNCESISDAESIIENIRQANNVEDAWSDGHELHIKVKDWETMTFHFSHSIDDNATMAKNVEEISSAISKIKKSSNIIIDKPSIVIANQRDNNLQDDSFTSLYTTIIDQLESEGFDAKYVPMPSIDFFYKDMYDYDVVLLTTHGGYSPRDGHDFMTGYELGKIRIENSDIPTETMKELWSNKYNKIFDDPKYAKSRDDISWTWHKEERIINGQLSKYWVAYAVVFDSFFEHTAAKQFSNPNSILFNTACMSLKGGNQVAEIFMNKRNLGTYLGYDESNYYGPFSGGAFVVYLVSGVSAEKTKENLDNVTLTLSETGDGNTISGSYTKENIDVHDSNGNFVRSYTAELNMLPEDNLNRFVTTVYTIEKDNSEVNQDYSNSQSVKIEGIAGIQSDKDISLYFGFEITYYDPVTNTWKIKAEVSQSDDKTEFCAYLENLQPGRKYFYRAYTYDGMNYNYGDTYSFTIENSSIEADKELMITKNVNGTVYSIYKKTLDENDYHTNPDGWKCYRTQLTLEITKNGTTNSYVVDNNIYLDKEEDHHGGQQPCMLLDFNKNMIYIFCNSKDDLPYYSMDGNFYSSSMSNINFTKETVFETANWGWFPYFCDFGDDNINLCNFSFAGYFTIMAVRDTSGNWNLYYYNTDISPEEAQAEWEQADKILVIETPL